MDFPYLNNDVKHGASFERKDILSTPFPQTDEVPDFLFSTTFFLEWVENVMYLRSTENPLFCKQVDVIENSFIHQRLDEIKEEMITEEKSYKLLIVYFHDDVKTVGYIFDDEFKLFLSHCSSKLKHGELDANLQWLYHAARLGTVKGLAESLQKMNEKLYAKHGSNYGLKPIDEFAEKLLYEKYNGDFRRLTDSEYVRVFGVSRNQVG